MKWTQEVPQFVPECAYLSREVSNGVGVDGVRVKFPIFRQMLLDKREQEESEEKQRKTKRSEEKPKNVKKMGKFPPTPSAPTLLRTSQLKDRASNVEKHVLWESRSRKCHENPR